MIFIMFFFRFKEYNIFKPKTNKILIQIYPLDYGTGVFTDFISSVDTSNVMTFLFRFSLIIYIGIRASIWNLISIILYCNCYTNLLKILFQIILIRWFHYYTCLVRNIEYRRIDEKVECLLLFLISLLLYLNV